MALAAEVPFNINILHLTDAKLDRIRPVSKLDIFKTGDDSQFDDDGLFSTILFGRVGDPLRNKRFSYISVHVELFHPLLFKVLTGMKSIYRGIIEGTEYAVWNSTINDFDKSDPINGKTGYDFFVKNWKNIKFVANQSAQRTQHIALIEKTKDIALTSRVVVIPAGLRDVEMGEDGRVQEDEINELYRKLLSATRSINPSTAKSNPELYNNVRVSLQNTFNAIYENLAKRIEGKQKLMMGKWAGRRIQDGTRNVITAMEVRTNYLGSKESVGFNDTMIGLYQAMKSIMPIARYHVRNGYLAEIFGNPNQPVYLVNKKTLKSEAVNLKSMFFERYATNEGIDKLITSFKEESIRDKPIEVEGRYLGLIYRGPNDTFKIFNGIEQLPEDFDASRVTPLTLAELLYASVYKVINKYPTLVTRYPITGIGSIYPSQIYTMTTLKSEVRRELSKTWVDDGLDEHIAPCFPTKGPYFNSLSPHPSRLARLGADFDGDMTSANSLYTNESVQTVKNFFNTKRAYLGTDGKFISSIETATVKLTLANLTRGLKKG